MTYMTEGRATDILSVTSGGFPLQLRWGYLRIVRME
jgi:hypothetical protein